MDNLPQRTMDLFEAWLERELRGGGFLPYTLSIAANSTRALSVRGRTIYVYDTSAPVLITPREYEVGQRSGSMQPLEMGTGESITTPRDFDNITVENETSATVTVKFYIGYGEFKRENPKRAPVADNIVTGWLQCPVETDGASFPANPLRKRITIQLPAYRSLTGPTATAIVGALIGATEAAVVNDVNGAGGVASGHLLLPGSSITLETTSEIFVATYGSGEGDTSVHYIEETYDA